MKNKYKAWIPNVSGSLSFSNIKGTRIPGRASHPKTFNHLSDHSKGFIYSLQKRNLSDAIYAPIDCGGDFYYLLIAEVENALSIDEALTGHILTFPKQQVGSDDNELIRHFSKSNLETDIPAQLAEIWKSRPEAIIVSFKLYHDGFAELMYEGADDENEPSFIFETYSFLKDLVHSHKFHRFDDDAIVVPYPVKDESDNLWVGQTLRNLHKSVVSTYRNAQYSADLINAIGRLSYLESFQCAAQRKFKQALRDDQVINLNTLRASLESKLESVRETEERRSVILTYYIPLLLTILALMLTMTQLLQIPCIEGLTENSECKWAGKPFTFKLGGESVEVARHILQHWYEYLIAIPITTFVVILIAHFSKIRRWLNYQIGHGFVGWLLRFTLGLAISEKGGRILASIWIMILMVVLVWLSVVAMGILHQWN